MAHYRVRWLNPALCISISLILFACGGGGSSGSGDSASSSSGSGNTSSGGSSEDIANGKALFDGELSCGSANCHGSTGTGLIALVPKQYELSSLAANISATMPPGDASQCEGSCADDTAAYILSLNAAANGKTLYDGELSCGSANCHGPTGTGLFPLVPKQYEFTTLSANISATMPQGNPSQCEGSCADDIARYVLSLNDGSSGPADNPTITVDAPNITGAPALPEGIIDAAPVTISRLNRSEYNNTVRDLLGSNLKPANSFPEDDFSEGFNNLSSTLSVSLTHIEQYEQAAERLLDEMFGVTVASSSQFFEAEELGSEVGGSANGAWNLWANGSILVPATAEGAGQYAIRVRAGQMPAGDDNAHMAVTVNNSLIIEFDVAALDTAMETYEYLHDFPAGDMGLSVEFNNDFYDAPDDRNLLVDWIEIEGPLGVEGSGPSSPAQIPCDVLTVAGTQAETCLRETIGVFGAKAWRRPLESAEIERLVVLYDAAIGSEEATVIEGFRQVLKAILLSPNFMYRAEFDDSLNSTTATALQPYELASRLSYFLWSSMPDDTLFALAEDGTLVQDEVLRAQVQRMLSDTKAEALIENFAVQWLRFDKVLDAEPNAQLFPDFDDTLIQSMRTETRLFLQEIFDNNRPIEELLTANYTYVNSQLAAHYGMSVTPDGFERIERSNTDPRRGLFGQGSILTSTSHSASTSPVRRGVWVLEALMCAKPPPPPPAVENIAGDIPVTGLTTRERFERHRQAGSSCFACHQTMDPIGFGLENFDPVGQIRAEEGGESIDTAGELPDGTAFSGAAELADILADSWRLSMCTIKHLLSYGTGRGLHAFEYSGENADYPAIYDIYLKTEPKNHGFQDLIEEVVMSEVFRMRRGADSNGGSEQ